MTPLNPCDIALAQFQLAFAAHGYEHIIMIGLAKPAAAQAAGADPLEIPVIYTDAA